MPTRNTATKAIARGFTLLEVMIVLVIIGVLGGIVTYNLVGAAEKAKIDATKTSLKTIAGAMGMYYSTYNAYPVDIDMLAANNPVNKIRDSWERRMEIFVPSPDGFSFEVRSAGSDGQLGTADDLIEYPEHEKVVE